MISAGLLPFEVNAETRLVREDRTGLSIDFELPSVRSEPGFDGSVILSAPGAPTIGRSGFPSVPAESYLIAIPPGAVVSVSFSNLRVEETDRYPVAPYPWSDDEGFIPAEWDPSLSGGLWPVSWFELSSPKRMRDQAVVNLTIYPVRHDHSTGRTDILRSARIDVHFAGGKDQAIRPPASRSPAFETLYDRVLLNAGSSRSWRTLPAPSKTARSGDSFHSSDQWMRVGIDTTGFYSIDYAQFVAAGITDPRTAIGDPRTIRVYTGTGRELPEAIDGERDTWMKQTAVLVRGENDGSFDPGDRIEFFALGPIAWEGEYATGADPYYNHIEHTYSIENVYWITWNGSFEEPQAPRMGEFDGGAESPGATNSTVLETFPEWRHFEKDIFEDLTRYGTDGWFWDRYTQNATDKSFRNLATPSVDSTQPQKLRASFMHYDEGRNTGGTQRAIFWVNGVPADTLRWNSADRGSGSILSGVHSAEGNWGLSNSTVVRILVDQRPLVYLDWIEIGYERRFTVSNGPIRFRLETPGDFSIPISGLGGESIRLFDVSEPFVVGELVGFEQDGATAEVFIRVSEASTYRTVSESEWKTPASFERKSMPDLREPSEGAEYLVIVYDEWEDEIAPLVEHRSGKYLTKTVLLSDVFDQFSWGLEDAMAIRDFIAHAYHNWPTRPIFVLLAGDASADFKGRLRSEISNDLHTFFRISRTGVEELTYPTDDLFTYVDPLDDPDDQIPDLAIGRLPANSIREMEIMVDKLVRYDQDPEFGLWKNRILLLADDELKPTGGVLAGDCAFRWVHTVDTETASKLIPVCFDIQKVYLMEFPLSANLEKPLARDAYIDWINEGYLLSSYIGHGGFQKMADENLFNASLATTENIRNGRRLPLFTAWSCSIGSFDVPDDNSLSEIFLKLDTGGAIGSFSSGAPAFGNPSAQLNQLFFDHLFPACGVRVPIGLAAIAAKSIFTSATIRKSNDEKYNLLGDPALELAFPTYGVEFDDLESLRFQRGAETSIRGTVLDETGAPAPGFNGDCLFTVQGMADTSGYAYDDSLCLGTPERPRPERAPYKLGGPVFFRGTADVVAGRFEVPFFVPLDTRIGDLGQIRAYVFSSSAAIDGAGGYDSIAVVPEPPNSEFEDQAGPDVKVTVDGAEIRDGTSFTSESIWRIDLEDESGINLQESDDFFSIHLVFDGGRPIDLTSLFEYDKGSYQKGSISFQFVDLPDVSIREGGHEFAFRASDNLNNRVEVDHQVVLVAEGSELEFNDIVLSYPNPFDPREEETTFYVDLSQSADISIEIFTITGRRIRRFERCAAFPGQTALVECVWDGRDQDGDPVANGTYLIRAIAESPTGAPRVETIGKAVVLHGTD